MVTAMATQEEDNKTTMMTIDDGYEHKHKRHKMCKKAELTHYDQLTDYHGFIVWQEHQRGMHPQPAQELPEANVKSPLHFRNQVQFQIELI